ncbi:hypothetical protein O9992_03505 [Vibrio lentus]|nr:hypothetical protein [Vibrio lentus]
MTRFLTFCGSEQRDRRANALEPYVLGIYLSFLPTILMFLGGLSTLQTAAIVGGFTATGYLCDVDDLMRSCSEPRFTSPRGLHIE